MATLTDLQTKRDELNTAVQTYRSILQEFKDGIATQSSVDQAKSTAQTKGDEFAKLIQQVRRDNPELTDNDLFSNPAAQDGTKRDNIARAMRTGTVNFVQRFDFNDDIVDPSVFSITALAGTRYAIVDGGRSKFLRLYVESGNGVNNRITLSTLASYPVGTRFKLSVRQSSPNQAATFIWMRTGRYDGTPYLTAFSGKYVTPPVQIGGGDDELGQALSAGYTSAETHIADFDEFELYRASETQIEWYRNGTLVHTTNATFANDYPFSIELFRHPDSTQAETLDIDYIEIVYPPA